MVSLAACGDDAPPPPVALADFQQAAVDAVCDWAVRCRHVPDRATCERLIDPKDYDARRALDAVAAGRMTYDPVAGGACIEATRQAYCLTLPFSDASCDQLFSPGVPPGGMCTSDLECAGTCDNPSCGVQCCAGTCGPEPTGMPPEPEPRAQIGEPCMTHTDCVDEAYCEADFLCTARPTEEGEHCLFGCARGDLYCDTSELVCKRYGARGEACDVDGVTAPPCDPAWSYCDDVCVDRPGVGEPCGAQPQTCVATSFCNDVMVCQARGSAGDPCTTSDECQVVCNTLTGQCVDYMTCNAR